MAERVEDHRRKWDRNHFERLARERREDEEREEEEKNNVDPDKIPIMREVLRPRGFKIDLESKVGKTVVINKSTPGGADGGGYYCNCCDCVVKDSINFLDHINGKKHQRNLGMSMRIKKATVDDVKEIFEKRKQQVEEKKKDYNFEERLKEIKEEETKLQEYRRQKRLDMKKRKRGEDDVGGSEEGGDADQMASLMGFSGFGGAKK